MNERILLRLLVALACIGIIACNASASSKQKRQDSTAIMMITSTETAIQEPIETGVEVGEAIMTPGRNLADNVSRSKDHTTFTILLRASGLISSLKRAGPYTLFAPTNEAFNEIPAGAVDSLLLPTHKAELVQLVRDHLIAGSFTIGQLRSSQLHTLSGIPVSLYRRGGDWWINHARISIADVRSSNGTLHVTEAVLQP
ncbi:fasciclin domain-containing protein [Taibaiella koreensis]|uniref:fasciclin domain-containing protein n=1 Tax=Taibaiella koreensis TaxID=1268548 RepID=UPI000E59BE66|nr:fasciclin domain-containing protein [Taibaiella koreensis]